MELYSVRCGAILSQGKRKGFTDMPRPKIFTTPSRQRTPVPPRILQDLASPVGREAWYREALFDQKYQEIFRRYLQDRDVNELQRFVARIDQPRRAWTDLSKVMTDVSSDEELRYLWDLSKEIEEVSPVLYPDAAVPTLSDCAAEGLDIDITLPGLGEGGITLCRGGQYNEWGTWGEGIDHWMEGSLIDAVDSLLNDDDDPVDHWSEGFRGEVIGLIEQAGVEAIKKTPFWYQEGPLIGEVEPEE